MVWYPAIIVLVLGNAALLVAIAVVTVWRRQHPAGDNDVHALSALAVHEATVRFPAAHASAPPKAAHEEVDRALISKLLRDQDPEIRREAAAAAAASARAGYPRPLDADIVDALLRVLAEEPVHAVLVEAID